MNHRLPALLVALVALCAVPLFTAADWLQFRGTDTNGVAVGPAPPTSFSAKEGALKNIAWKAPLPGRGVCGPIVVGGKVVVTSASGFRHDRLHVLCFDAASGKLDWERQFWATGRTLCHPTSSVAAPTPCSDGKNIYAFFASNDLICLDLEGNLKWLRGLTHDYPTAANDVGMASSPVVIGQTVVVQVESYGDSFLAGIDTATGETRWRVPRPKAFNWASPTVLRGGPGDEDLVLAQSGKTIESIRPLTGETVWKYETACNNVSSTTTDGQTIFVPAEGLMAFRGEVGSDAKKLLWTQNKLTPSSASAVARDGKVYSLRGSVVVCGNAGDGSVLWQQRIKGRRYWATPVLAGNYLYLADDAGLVQVLDIRGKGKVVSENDLGDPVLGTPAIADGALYLRSDGHLWKIAKAVTE
jgi:outer membrane protein assembly factor BamB